MTDISHILAQLEAGAPLAAEAFMPLVYDELRKLVVQAIKRIILDAQARVRIILWGQLVFCGKSWKSVREARHFFRIGL